MSSQLRTAKRMFAGVVLKNSGEDYETLTEAIDVVLHEAQIEAVRADILATHTPKPQSRVASLRNSIKTIDFS